MGGITIEVDITHRCNLACHHCNRLCNADANYGIKRSVVDMDMRHIDYLISEVKKLPKGSVRLIRILGGEPLLSEIIINATQSFINLIKEGVIEELNIVTNGTVKVPETCKPYVVYAPQIVKQMVREKGLVTPCDIYAIKNTKHRNITVSPVDYDLEYDVCDRVKECGIHYTVFGFSYTAPCFPSIVVSPRNHKYFFHKLPHDVNHLIDEHFREEVCSICCFAIVQYKLLVENYPYIKDPQFHGREWSKRITTNQEFYIEPDTSWINNI